MSDNINSLYDQLAFLGLSLDEAKIYIELLKSAKTHLELARATGINRTKVYRLVEGLQKRSLVTKNSDDEGSSLTAKDPSTLEIAIVEQEEKLKTQRENYQSALPNLTALANIGAHTDMQVLTYDGVEGLKHMLWHELKTKGDNLILGYGTIEDLIGPGKWAEKHRQKTIESGYKIRELMNPDSGKEHENFTQVQNFLDSYQMRIVDPKVLNIEHNQVAIYNDTVAIYLWKDKRKTGVEIINQEYANMMRQMFEIFWQQAKPAK